MTAEVPHLLHVFSTFVPAGPELRFVRLANAAGAAFRHSILSIDGRVDAASLLDGELDARVLDPLPRAGTPATVRRLHGLLRELRPDAVLSYNFGALDAVIAARLAGVRVLHHEDGFNADEAQHFKRRREWLRRAFLPGVQRVIVPSSGLEFVARERWHLAPKKLALIPNGIRCDRFSVRDGNAALRAELGIAPDAFVVGFVGHLRPVKRPERLLEACAPLCAERDVHLLILGSGEERDELVRRAATGPLAGRVHLVGHRDDPRPYYAAMDAFALVSDSEQMPVALLEAMASALPVVATDVGDVRRILPEAQGPLCHPLSNDVVYALSKSLAALADDADLRRDLGAANRARVEDRYDFGAMLEAHTTLWRAAASPAS
ncbi:MAG: glycosyltransferase [Planctomycetes bacterium]|nr:glycosyltransferase [Planctomycetota bacterium]MCB9905377.1 glycosyltransferase [Planctomycetota bacterium]